MPATALPHPRPHTTGAPASRKHPAEIVLAALLSGRAVTLPDGRTYRLGEDLTLCVGTEEGRCAFSLPREMQVGDFLRLCDRLSAEDLFRIGLDDFLSGTGAQRQPSAL
jgi:hypothetical protein